MDFIIDNNGKKRKAEKVICNNCKKEFLKAQRFIKKSKNNFCSPECHKEGSRKERVIVNCEFCGKKKEITPYDFKVAKTKKFFCSKNHQRLAQFSHNGIDYHCNYTNGEYNYRKVAFRRLPNKCELCGYDEDIRILEVHHIDSDRSNNIIENLMILCPNCHTKITRKFYTLIDRFIQKVL